LAGGAATFVGGAVALAGGACFFGSSFWTTGFVCWGFVGACF